MEVGGAGLHSGPGDPVSADVLASLPVLAFGAGAPAGVVHLDGAPATPADRALVAERPQRADPDECVTICWTSGTESPPKSVPRCHYDWLPMLGQKGCAFVVVRPGMTIDGEELLDHLRRLRIAPYKLPERFVFVDRLPHNPVGKVTERTLRARLHAGGLAAEFA